MATTTIRLARAADADDMGRVHCEAWQGAYRGILGDTFLNELDPAERAAQWRRVIEANPLPAEGRRFVAELEGEVVGIALVWPDTSDAESGLGELVLINVTPPAWGSGAGTALMQACCHALADLGHDHGILWVFAGNDRARRFYERDGWHDDGGRRTEEVGGAPVDEVRYRIDLAEFLSRGPATGDPASSPGARSDG